MSRTSTSLLRAALAAAHVTRADRLARPLTGGVGVIFMLHHVHPAPENRAFAPNRILTVTPDFLEAAIREARNHGYECVSLDAAADRMARAASGEAVTPFACFTLDDGYRDNAIHAYPVFARQNVPFTIYVPSDYADGRAQLWWLALEEIIRRSCRVQGYLGGERIEFDTQTADAKTAAFHWIYWRIRALPEAEARHWIVEKADRAGFDARHFGADLAMSWDEIRTLARDPLVTIGAHTTRHFALANLSDDDARREMADNINRLESELQVPCRHISYPYGDAESASPREFELAAALGMSTGVTTRKGLISADHADTLALPRLSLNGDFQDRRYLRVLLSGLPFAMMRLAGRVGVSLESGTTQPNAA